MGVDPEGFFRQFLVQCLGGLVIAEGTLECPTVIGCMGSFPAKSAAVSLDQWFLSPVDLLLNNDVSWVIFIGQEVDNSSPGIL